MKENYFNSEFIDLIKDDQFVRLVNESENPDLLLKNLLAQNPEKSKDIKYAFEFVRLAKDDKKQLDSSEFDAILMSIESKLKADKIKGGRLAYLSKLKIASIILVVIAVGSSIFYYQYTKDPLKQFAEESNGKTDKSMLILSDGSEHVLSNNDSKIDYNSSHGQVIVKDQQNAEEKYQNSAAPDLSVLNQVVVPYGQRQRVVLCDGTVVKLNAGSRLTFPAAFSGKTREVYLKGEGFFEVHKDSSHPFVVKTDFLDVKVLGTVFNVSAYDDENVTSAVLVEGRVNISQKDRILSNKSFVLSPGQGCFYSVNDKKSDVKNVDVDLYTSWTDGVYQFRDMSLLEVVRKVRKYYNVFIQIEGQELSDTKISGKLVISGDVTQAVQYIAKTVEGRFEKNKDGNYIIKN